MAGFGGKTISRQSSVVPWRMIALAWKEANYRTLSSSHTSIPTPKMTQSWPALKASHNDLQLWPSLGLKELAPPPAF